MWCDLQRKRQVISLFIFPREAKLIACHKQALGIFFRSFLIQMRRIIYWVTFIVRDRHSVNPDVRESMGLIG